MPNSQGRIHLESEHVRSKVLLLFEAEWTDLNVASPRVWNTVASIRTDARAPKARNRQSKQTPHHRLFGCTGQLENTNTTKLLRDWLLQVVLEPSNPLPWKDAPTRCNDWPFSSRESPSHANPLFQDLSGGDQPSLGCQVNKTVESLPKHFPHPHSASGPAPPRPRPLRSRRSPRRTALFKAAGILDYSLDLDASSFLLTHLSLLGAR